ncbi:sigma-70 family RNA polymerase sigma factor [Nannocystaceae bacterium ST9]
MSDRDAADSGWGARFDEVGAEAGFGLDVGPEPATEPEFERMYRDHYAFVWRCAKRMGVPAGDLDDVLQDTFVAAYRRFESWDRESRATTWLFGILRNVMRNRVRGLIRHQRRIDALARETAPPEQPGERMLASELLRGFLASLDDDKRAVFVLAELEGLTGSEIGRALAISPNTASSRLRAARQAFADHFEQREVLRRVERATRQARERPEQPPAGAAERTLALVLIGPSSGIAAASASGGLATLGLGKLLIGASVGLLAIVTLPKLIAAPEPAPTVELAKPSDAAPRRSPTPASVVAAAPSLDEPAITVLADALERPRPRTQAPAPARPDLAGYEALRAAREHVIGERPESALALLDTLDARDAALREAVAATRIAALCQLDRASEAEATWSRLHAIDPESALVDRLRDACWSTR